MSNPPTTSTYPLLGAFMRDDNSVPITWRGLIASNSKTLIGNNATVAVPIFTVTGQVEITGIWGVITTALGNNTAAYWRTNDGTTQNSITLSTGTSLTTAIVGGVISKKAGVATALTLTAATSPQVLESATAGATYFQDFVVIANPLATSNIEFVYTTTDTPTTGAIPFYIRWVPITRGSSIVLL
jgi:hypothetical protein